MSVCGYSSFFPRIKRSKQILILLNQFDFLLPENRLSQVFCASLDIKQSWIGLGAVCIGSYKRSSDFLVEKCLHIEVSEPGVRENFFGSTFMTESVVAVLLQELPHDVLKLIRVRDFAGLWWEADIVIQDFLAHTSLARADERSIAAKHFIDENADRPPVYVPTETLI